MKRFHAHLSVEDLDSNVEFYNKLFSCEPIKLKNDYAKWELDDPALNFSISSRGAEPGFNHFGIQVDSTESLQALRAAAEEAGKSSVLDEGDTTCCYANSNKHWTLDPQGIAWEHFYTLSDTITYGNSQIAKASEEHLTCCTSENKDT